MGQHGGRGWDLRRDQRRHEYASTGLALASNGLGGRPALPASRLWDRISSLLSSGRGPDRGRFSRICGTVTLWRRIVWRCSSSLPLERIRHRGLARWGNGLAPDPAGVIRSREKPQCAPLADPHKRLPTSPQSILELPIALVQPI